MIDHPALQAALALPLTELHSFAIDTAPADRLHAERRFPIHRAPGTIHLGYEPRSFAAVPLAVVHLGTGPLNVGLLFSAPRPLTVLGPQDGDRTGWVHREVLLPWEVFMRGGGSRLLYRRERTVQAAGVFFRLHHRDVLELVRLLTSLGVRRGFNCQDWSHATGIPHP